MLPTRGWSCKSTGCALLTFSRRKVPAGHCWVVGDNLPDSRDSRYFGPLPLALIKGKVIAKTWPLGEFRWIENTLLNPSDR